jgi:DNA ligase-1
MPIRVNAHAKSPRALRVNNVHASLGDGKNVHLVEDRNLQPMLAQSWDKYGLLMDKMTVVAASPKLDGIRCVVAQDPKTKKALFFSRNGALFDCCSRIEPAVQKLFDKDPGLVLDGELYNHQHFANDFSAVSSAVRTSQARLSPAVEKLQRLLELHCFDVMHSSRLPPNSGYKERYEYLAGLLAGSSDASPMCTYSKFDTQPIQSESVVQLVPAWLIAVGDLDRCFRDALKDGFEGLMVKLLDEPYRHGMRSTGLLKMKQMHDQEYVIAGAVEGTGKWRKTLGAFICKAPNGQLFSVTPSVKDEMRLKLWHRRSELLGKALTVQYQEITANGVPRFPIGKAVRGLASGSDWV